MPVPSYPSHSLTHTHHVVHAPSLSISYTHPTQVPSAGDAHQKFFGFTSIQSLRNLRIQKATLPEVRA